MKQQSGETLVTMVLERVTEAEAQETELEET
jgi:hypothetical protein